KRVHFKITRQLYSISPFEITSFFFSRTNAIFSFCPSALVTASSSILVITEG
uniref:Ovule protein n=1 Tax=Parascaris univalens TaxID=6257 RepID=A0A915C991_PARUN